VEEKRGLSEVKPYEDVLKACSDLMARAKLIDHSLL
jgi:hypothetical protein